MHTSLSALGIHELFRFATPPEGTPPRGVYLTLGTPKFGRGRQVKLFSVSGEPVCEVEDRRELDENTPVLHMRMEFVPTPAP